MAGAWVGGVIYRFYAVSPLSKTGMLQKVDSRKKRPCNETGDYMTAPSRLATLSMRQKYLYCLLILFLDLNVSPIAWGAITYNMIALSGDAGLNLGFGPNLGAGIQFSSFTVPVINANGHVAFGGGLEGAGISWTNNFGVWTNVNGPLNVAVRAGSDSQGPNVGAGVRFSVIHRIGGFQALLNDEGKLVVVGRLTGTGISIANDQGIWIASDGSVNVLARTGTEPGPGLGAGINFRTALTPDAPFGNLIPGPGNVVAVDNAGRVSFFGTLGGTGINSFNDLGIWKSDGSVSVVAREGTQGPGPNLEPGTYFFQFWHEMAMNSSGQITFGADLTGNGNSQGIWTSDGNSLSLIARTHPNGPGPNLGSEVIFSGLTVPTINATGNVAFRGWIAGPGIDSSNDNGIWTNVGGAALTLVAREGTAELGPNVEAGVTFKYFAKPLLNSSGDTAFFATLQGPGIDTSNEEGLWMRRRDGTLHLIARDGASVPDAGDGVNFHFLSPAVNSLMAPFMNSSGEIVFATALIGDGVSSANNQGVWAWTQGRLIKLVRRGDLFDVNPDPLVEDLRTVAGTALSITSNITGSGGGDGRPSILNDDGLVVLGLIFTDGSSGIFTAQLPRQPGDFDNDGDVDGADFVAWQTNYPMEGGAARADGDGDGDGDVDGADFGVWQTNFGGAPDEASSPVPVPEPGAGWIGASGLIVILAAAAFRRGSGAVSPGV